MVSDLVIIIADFVFTIHYTTIFNPFRTIELMEDLLKKSGTTFRNEIVRKIT